MLQSFMQAGAGQPSLPPLTAQQTALRESIQAWRPATGRMASDIPSSLDNSRNKYFPQIFSQGIDNSCSQASGVRYVYTYETNRMLDREASDPTNVFCYHFTWNFLNEANNEGSHAWIGWDLMKECGTLDISSFEDGSSYANQTVWPTGYDTYLKAMDYRVESYSKFNLKTREGINLLRRYIFDHGDGSSTGGIATISYETDDWGLRSYNGPSQTAVKHIVTREGKDGPHAITITGYDDTVEYDFNSDGVISEDERGAFIFVNSWGDFWASDGRCFIPYSVLLADPSDGGLSEGDADAYMVKPLVESPSMVFDISFSYDRRSELSFNLGAADGSDAGMPTVDFYYPIMNRQGGTVPMQGRGKSTSMEVSMNFSRYYDAVKKYEEPKFFLSVRRTAASGTGAITSFRVRDLVTGQIYESRTGNISLTGGMITLTAGAVRYYPSCSKWMWLYKDTSTPIASPFVVRTATGDVHRMQVTNYDRSSGKITIKHSKL